MQRNKDYELLNQKHGVVHMKTDIQKLINEVRLLPLSEGCSKMKFFRWF